MIKAGEVINEYRIPRAYAGVAVRRACEFITHCPGASQVSVLNEALVASGLHGSNAGWITSPSNPWNGKSPATKLWDRRREKVYNCYPNEFTAQVTGSDVALAAAVTQEVKHLTKLIPTGLKSGELVAINTWDKNCTAMFVGVELLSRTDMSIASAASVEDLILAMQSVKLSPHSYVNCKFAGDSGLTAINALSFGLGQLMRI